MLKLLTVYAMDGDDRLALSWVNKDATSYLWVRKVAGDREGSPRDLGFFTPREVLAALNGLTAQRMIHGNLPLSFKDAPATPTPPGLSVEIHGDVTISRGPDRDQGDGYYGPG